MTSLYQGTTFDQDARQDEVQPDFEQRQRQFERWEEQPSSDQRQKNVGDSERAVSVAAGAILGLLGISRRSVPGMLIAGVGGALIYRRISGYCPLCAQLGIDSAHPSGDELDTTEREINERGIQIAQSFLINRSPEELYQFWRNFENLPRIMSYLESVRTIDQRRSHWVAKAPRLAGGKVEWDAEITRDEPNSLIAWRSLPGSDIDTDLAVLRYVTTVSLNGRQFSPFIIVPTGRVKSTLNDGVTPPATSSGFGDLQIGGTLGLIGSPALPRPEFLSFKPGFNMSVFAKVSFPTCGYISAKPGNLGSNR